MAIALSGDDLARLRMIGTLRARLAEAVRFDTRNLRAVQLSARFYRIAPWWLGGGSSDALAMITRAAALAPARADELRGIDAFDARNWPDAVRYLQRVNDHDGNRANAGYYLAETI